MGCRNPAGRGQWHEAEYHSTAVRERFYMSNRSYDFVVIGGGPAGHHGAIQAAKCGAKTVLIDRRPRVGGTCLHSGTIPSKTLREAVIYFSGLRQKQYYGKSFKTLETITLDDLLLRVEKVLSRETGVMESQLERNGVEVIHGQAAFEDAHTLVVSSGGEGPVETIKAEKILVAVGTVPRRPDEIPFDQEVIFDSNFIFSSKNKRKKLPKSLIVIGSGVIGTEYACMFAALGCEVWLLDRRKEMFRFLDHDIYDQLLLAISKAGVQLVLQGEIGAIHRSPDGEAVVELEGGAALKADVILFAMGRTPCTFTLKLENVEIATNQYGVIEVDKKFRTSQEHIYAAGDVIGFPALASTSAEQGRMAARYALGLKVHSKPELFPFAIYTIPEISMVGKTEQELIKEGTPYVQGLAFYRELPKGAIIGDVEGALKILIHSQTRKILGVHMIGDLASELLHIGSIAMNLDATIDIFVDSVFNYPTLAEAYKIAALNGMNKLETNTNAPFEVDEQIAFV